MLGGRDEARRASLPRQTSLPGTWKNSFLGCELGKFVYRHVVVAAQAGSRCQGEDVHGGKRGHVKIEGISKEEPSRQAHAYGNVEI